jgi:hypothetical protein
MMMFDQNPPEGKRTGYNLGRWWSLSWFVTSLEIQEKTYFYAVWPILFFFNLDYIKLKGSFDLKNAYFS